MNRSLSLIHTQVHIPWLHQSLVNMLHIRCFPYLEWVWWLQWDKICCWAPSPHSPCQCSEALCSLYYVTSLLGVLNSRLLSLHPTVSRSTSSLQAVSSPLQIRPTTKRRRMVGTVALSATKFLLLSWVRCKLEGLLSPWIEDITLTGLARLSRRSPVLVGKQKGVQGWSDHGSEQIHGWPFQYLLICDISVTVL